MSILPLPVIVAQLTKINGCSEDLARAFLVDFADLVGAALADQGFCEVKGIGVFRKIEAGGTVTVEFGPDPSLAEAVNLPFSMFEPVELDDEVTEDMLEAAAEEAETSVMAPLTAAKRDEAPADVAVPSEVDEEPSEVDEEPSDVDASEVGNTADDEPQTEESEEARHVTDTPVRETVVEDTVVEETPQPEPAPVHGPSRQASRSRAGVRQVPRSLNEKIAEQRREAPAVTYERVIEKERVVENNHHTMNIVLTAFLALMAGLLIGFFAYDRLNLSAVKSVNISAEDVQVYHAASDVPEAKAEPTEVDSTLIKTDPEPRAAVAEKTVPEIPEASVATPGVVTDTVRAGRFLTTMAQKHYGKKKFWVYIYMENIDKLGDPDLIPPMTTVVIPPASKYGIKPGDRASEEAAERKAAEIMSRYSKN